MPSHHEHQDKEIIPSKLKAALLSLLEEKDILHITGKEIAEHASVSRGALYFYYEDKFDILAEIVEEQKDGLRKAIYDSLKDLDYINLQQMKLKALPALSYVADHVPFFRNMLNRNNIPYINFHSFFIEVFNKEVVLIPEKPDLSDTVKDMYVHYRTLYTYAIILYWFKEGMKSSPETISRQYWELVSQKRFYWIFGSSIKPKDKEARPDRRITRTRQALQAAMIDLIVEKENYSAVTISEITRKSNIRRATFYDHYSSIEDLFKATIHNTCSDIIDILTIDIKPESFTAAQAEEVLIQLFSYLSEHTSIIHFMNGKHGVPDPVPEILNVLSGFYLEQQIDIHAGKDMYAYYISSLIVGLILYRLQEGRNHSPQYLAREFIQFLDLKKYKIHLY